MNREPRVEMNESAFDPTEAVRSLWRESAEWLRIVGFGIAIVVGFGVVSLAVSETFLDVLELADPLFAFVFGIGPFAGPIVCMLAIAGLWIGVLRFGMGRRSWIPLIATMLVVVAIGLLMGIATEVAIRAAWPSALDVSCRFGAFFGVLSFGMFLPVRGLKLGVVLVPAVVLLGIDPRLASAFVALAFASSSMTVPVSGPTWRGRCARVLWAVGGFALLTLTFAAPSTLAFMLAVPTLTDAGFAALGIATVFGIGRLSRRPWIDPNTIGASWIRAVVVGLFAAAGAVWLARVCAEFVPQARLWPSNHDRPTKDAVWMWILGVWVFGGFALFIYFERGFRREREQMRIERRSRGPDRLARLFQRRPAFTIGSGFWAFLAAPLLITVLAWNHRVAPFQSTRLLAVDAPIDAMDIESTEFVALAPVTEIPEGDAGAEVELGVRRGFVDLERWGDAYVVHGLRFDGEPQSGSPAEGEERARLVGFVGRGRMRYRVSGFDGDDEPGEWHRASGWFDGVKERMTVRELDLGAAVLLRRDPAWPADWKQQLELAPSGRFTLRVTDDGIARADDVTIDGLSIDAWLAQSPR
ncbi:MAG: hypothetical protein IPH13_14270 [Planctomycetes bacterium]|nr:hypothetical protein [Planctomycetota bacterium]MCC7171764.1 hypothetical protein [Planctomycetota bacterium]